METKEMKLEIQKQIAEMLAGGLPGQCGEIVIREGKAMEIHEPVKVGISGTLDAPARWLETRMRLGLVNQGTNHVLVDREDLSIKLQCNENNHYGSVIVGSLDVSPEFKKFGINGGEYITNFEMAELFKMNRTCFENKQTAMKLVTELQNFKAKVDKDIEKMDNNRGDRRLLINQVVQSIMNSRKRRRNKSWDRRIGCGYCIHENSCCKRRSYMKGKRYPLGTRYLALSCRNFKIDERCMN